MGWNAFLFFINKSLYLSLSLLLYQNLSTNDFSLWANIQSSIFLLLLWLDCGFRKSLPRFAPEFANSTDGMNRFTRKILLFQTCLLFATSPLFFMLLSRITGISNRLLYLGILIFVVEGIVSILRLLFHSYFLQKQFNLIVSTVLLIQMATCLLCITFITKSHALLQAIFISKLISGALIIIIGAMRGKKILYRQIATKYNNSHMPSFRDFIKHSFFMWITTVMKSLTERNTLVPLFTYMLGPATANLFKIANDGALFFQRIVIKTIGTTDTSLLTYTELSPKKNELLPQMFETLLKNFIRLCVPIIVIIFVFGPQMFGTLYHGQILKLFFIMSISYLIHVLFFPFERLLEVKKWYNTLLLSHTPYTFLIILFFLFYPQIPSIGLLTLATIPHIARLTSALIMFLVVKKKFRFFFPVKFTLLILGITIILSFIALGIWHLLIG